MKARIIRDVPDADGYPHGIPIGTIVTLTGLSYDPGCVESRGHGHFFADELEPLDHGAVELCVAASEELAESVRAPRAGRR